MKKIIITFMLLISCIYMGCGEKKEDFSSCFQNILQQRDAAINWIDEVDHGLDTYYGEHPENTDFTGWCADGSDIDTENQYILQIPWIQLGDKILIENVSADMSGYMEKAGCNHACVRGVFYDETQNTIRVPVSAMESKYTWLLYFSIDSPDSITVFEFPDKGNWFGDCYRLQDYIYLNGGSRDIPLEISFMTGQARYCDQEYENAQNTASEWIEKNAPEWSDLQVFWFYAIDRQKDGTIIYNATVQKDMDTEVYLNIYQAYKDDQLVKTMIIREDTGECIIE